MTMRGLAPEVYAGLTILILINPLKRAPWCRNMWGLAASMKCVLLFLIGAFCWLKYGMKY